MWTICVDGGSGGGGFGYGTAAEGRRGGQHQHPVRGHPPRGFVTRAGVGGTP